MGFFSSAEAFDDRPLHAARARPGRDARVLPRDPRAARLLAFDAPGSGAKIDTWFVDHTLPVSGPTHLCWKAATRAEVDAFHAAALGAGGVDNGAPGLRPHYHAHYYGAFVLDPDGNNVEAVCHDAPP